MSEIIVNSLNNLAGTSPVVVSDIATSTDLVAPTGASLIGYTPTGLLTATTVEGALNEVRDASKVSYTPAGTGVVATDVQTVLRETISVTRYGAVGDGVTDDTAAIQAAVDFAVVNNIVTNGRPCSVHFPHGSYKITDTITISGAVALIGDGAPMSISGARIFQYTGNKSVFSVVGATNAAIYIYGLLLKDVSGVANQNVGLFHADSSTTSGNSFYLRDTWLSTPSYYAVNIQCNSDDLQIVNCTFDVTGQKFINLGSLTKTLSNFSIQGCTFYAGSTGLGFIDVINAQAGIISNNRFYEGGSFGIPYAISLPNALSSNIVVSGNTCADVNSLVITQSSKITVTGNNVYGGTSAIAVGGGIPVDGLVITGNYLSGSAGVSAGVIDCTGTQITNSVISNNSINGNSSSGYALNLANNSFTGNVITDNAVTGCTINNAGYGLWVPRIAGTSTAGTLTYTTQNGTWETHGNSVTLKFNVEVSGVSVAPTGQLIIADCPFSAVSDSYGYLQMNTINYPAGGYTQAGADIASGQNSIRVLVNGDNLALNVVDAAIVATGDTVRGQITYQIT